MEASESEVEAAGPKKKTVSQKKLLKEFAFLHPDPSNPDETLRIVKGWESNLSRNSEKTQVANIKTACSLAVEMVQSCLGVPSEKDFLIVRRGKEFEVWSARAFEPGELRLSPESGGQMKDSLWTYSRCALLSGSEKLHPEKKFVVIDGRLQGQPEGPSPFSLFFLVGHSEKKEECNLEHKIVTMSASLQMSGLPLPGGNEVAFDKFPGIPVMTNPRKIEKGMKLVVQDDINLDKAQKAMNAMVAKEEKKRHKGEEDEAIEYTTSV